MPANIRLGWKGLPRTSALAYYEEELLTGEREREAIMGVNEKFTNEIFLAIHSGYLMKLSELFVTIFQADAC